MAEVLELKDINEKLFPKIGGKAKNLYILSKNGFNVPEWFVITTDIYKRFIEENGIREKIEEIIDSIDFKNQNSIAEGSRAIKQLFLEKDIPKKDYRKIISAFKKIKIKSNSKYVAVRSSAVGEDEVKTSFAGQMDSFLFISEEKRLISCIKQCWASAFSERALSYRYLSNLSISDIEIAVIVQEMIFGDVSGVMFTVNPISCNINEILINSTYGIGEGIVSGELDTDSFYVNKQTNSFSQNIVTKKHKIVFNEKKGEGTCSIPVEREKQNKPSLAPATVKELANIGKNIEKLYSRPQDIEWTVKLGRIYILQTRPITTLSYKEGSREKDFKIIWDNSNIIESFPGITKPLTFSVARMAWSSVFRQCAEAMGVPSDIIEKNEQIFDNMIGLIHGRVYYNLMSWYRLTSFFPGFKYNRRYMEQMMGVKESYQFEEDEFKMLSKEGILGLPKLLSVLYGIFKNYLTLDKDIKLFLENFEKYYAELTKKDIQSMEPWEIMEIFYQAKSKLLRGWRVSAINSYSAMFFYGLVRSLTIKWGLDSTGSLHNDLFCGEKGMESTKPTRELIVLAMEVKNDKKLYNLFVKNNEKTILKELRENKEFSSFNRKFSDYLNKYGFRCMNELKLEEKSLKDDPSFAIQIIRNYLKLNKLDLDEMNKKELEKRRKAEQIVNEKLKWKPLKRMIFYWTLRNARKNVKYRENLRLCRTKIFGLIREAARSIGNKFTQLGIIEQPDDIFYLEIDEIFDFIKGTSNFIDIKSLIEFRKKEYEKFERETLPNRFVTYGIVNNQEICENNDFSRESEQNRFVLKGVSCCPGIVKGKAKVILSPKDNIELNGEIIVAERTDPGWVPLYPSASGLLIERGSVLSHSAIVARELGLPTIVGIKNLTKMVKDGQVIKMDAGKGIVYLKPDEEISKEA
jgi:pyruvate,water dikinase